MCETRLYGTWRLAILGTDKLFLATNSGDLFLSRNEDSVVFSSEPSIAEELTGFNFEKVKKNSLYEISFTEFKNIVETPLHKQTELSKNPMNSKHIYLEEIKACVDTVQWVTDFGAKLVAEDEVCLGGFDKAKEELVLI